MIITGPGIEAGAVPDNLVNSADLFVTIMEMAGIDPDETIPDDVTHDSVSFMSVLSDPYATPRDWIYVDEFFGGFAGVETADYAMRDQRHKLMRLRYGGRILRPARQIPTSTRIFSPVNCPAPNARRT